MHLYIVILRIKDMHVTDCTHAVAYARAIELAPRDPPLAGDGLKIGLRSNAKMFKNLFKRNNQFNNQFLGLGELPSYFPR